MNLKIVNSMDEVDSKGISFPLLDLPSDLRKNYRRPKEKQKFLPRNCRLLLLLAAHF